MWQRDDSGWKTKGCFGCIAVAALLFVGGLLLFFYLLSHAASN